MNRDIAHKRIAVTAWGDRVSPVFDSAQTLLLIEMAANKILERRYQHFHPWTLKHHLPYLLELEPEVIICGAISEEPALVLEKAGIMLISFISGEIEEILPLYMQGNKNWCGFAMPGCCRRQPSCRRTPCNKPRRYTHEQEEKQQF